METASGIIISDGILTEYPAVESDIIVPDKVKGISSAVFKDFDVLHSVVLPAGLEVIDSRCFEGCINLRSVRFPDSIVSIGANAFAGCSSLQLYRLPSGLRRIGPYAFKNCTSLRSIEIPGGVEEIDVGAFSGCSDLASVHFRGSWTVPKVAFGKHPFTGCGRIIIHAPEGSAAERFANENGISVVSTHPLEKEEKNDKEKDSYADAAALSSSVKPAPAKRRAEPAEKVRFVFGTPDSEETIEESAAAERKARAEEKARREAEAAAAAAAAKAEEEEKKAAAERHAAHLRELEERKNRQVYDEAVSQYEYGTEGSIQQAISMLSGIEGYADSKQKIKQYTKDLKKKKKENEQKLRAEQKKIEEAKPKAEKAKRPKPEKAAKPKPEKVRQPKPEKVRKPKTEKKPFPVRTVLIILAIVLAAGAGAAAVYFPDKADTTKKSTDNTVTESKDYTLTLEDFINSNEAAKEQIIESVEGTDVNITVSENTLIYNYDLSTSNSMTPEIAESDEIRVSLGETLDANDEKFTELCAGLEKDTGISGVSVRVVFSYGDKELLSRTYTSAGKEQ